MQTVRRGILIIAFSVLYISIMIACASQPNETRLHRAVIDNNIGSIKQEPQLTKLIDDYDKYGRTALHLAIMKNNSEIVKYLIETGADIDKMTYYGHSPLSLSLRHNDLRIASILIRAGAEVNAYTPVSSALIESVKFNRNEMSKKLMDLGADVNSVDRHHATPLYYAALLGNNDILSELISRGADPNIVTVNKMSPLHAAAFSESKPAVYELLESGGKIFPNDGNDKGVLSTALLYLQIAEKLEADENFNEALLYYNEAIKFNDIGTSVLKKVETSHKWAEFRKGLSSVGAFSINSPLGLLLMSTMTDETKQEFDFFSEDTDFLTTGFLVLEKTNPNCFLVDSVLGDKNVSAEMHPSRKIELINRNIYKCLSEKCSKQAEACKVKIEKLRAKLETGTKSEGSIFSDIGLSDYEEGIKTSNQLAKLYIYRERKNGFYGPKHFSIFVDNHFYCLLEYGKYAILSLEPGSHMVSISCSRFLNEIDFNSGFNTAIKLRQDEERFLSLYYNEKKSFVRYPQAAKAKATINKLSKDSSQLNYLYN